MKLKSTKSLKAKPNKQVLILNNLFITKTLKAKRGIFIITLILITLITINFTTGTTAQNSKNFQTCGDGTFYSTCSLKEPYFCLDGFLIESSSTCGCPEGFDKKENKCVSNFQNEEKEISLKYVLRGETGEIKFTIYNETKNYLSTLQRTISYNGNEIPSRADFTLKSIDEKTQREFLLPLVIAIQNSAKTKEDQARIAISVVQNLPYGGSNRTVNFAGQTIDYFRYPYEILYDNQGLCGEKVGLLAFMLREIGYGTAFFYFEGENHEALGIKCPIEKSLGKSGYCFVETTAPSIITEKEISYIGIGKLSQNFEVFLISEGMSLEENIYEYRDAQKMNTIRKSLEKNGKLNFILNLRNKKLEEKYGLNNEGFNSL